ncbi:MAG: AMP-binding protein [Eubacteriales bacterium]|nr:AMP-binding protein [Eubacteriales bacterium]
MLEKYLPRTEFDSYEDFKQNYRVNVPANFNFGFDIVDGWAKEKPDLQALVWCNDRGEEKSFTFTDIMKLSNRAANFFASKGIKKGDVVLQIMRRRWEYWVIATALCKLGAVVIPATLQLTAKDIAYRINASKAKMLVCVADEYVVEQAELAESECPTLVGKAIVEGERDGWIDFEKEFMNFPDTYERPTGADANATEDIMLIYFTSGTTGMPKMVEHNFSHPLGHIVTAKYWHQVQEGKLHMSITDSGWAKFGWGKIYGQWICGATIFCYDMDKFIPEKVLEKVEKYKITTFCCPPTMYRFMLQEDLTKYDLSSIEHCTSAGEPLNPEVVKKWKEYTGHMIHEGFGQTESTVIFANFQWFDVKVGSMGKPAPLYDIDLIDSEGNTTDDGDEGLIVVRGVRENIPTGLFVGYYQNEELTREALHGDYYSTGDKAWRDSDGHYWFVGRSDDVIKCSGYRIGPFEVESALIEHKAVVECAVTAVPHPVRGQVVKATVVLANGYEPSDELIKELQEHVKHSTAPYKYPRIVEFVDELPKTVGGKIKRALIRQMDEEKYKLD